MEESWGQGVSVQQSGIGNTQEVKVFNFYGNDGNVKLLQEMSAAVGSENYSVLICLPPEQLASKSTLDAFNLLSEEIAKNNIDVAVGGGYSLIPDGRGYPHLNEHDFLIERKCNAVIVFAEDYPTFIQMSHLSIIKDQLQSSAVELFCFYQRDAVANSEFMLEGPVAFFQNAAKGYLYDTNDIGDNFEPVVRDVIKALLRHKALRSRKAR